MSWRDERRARRLRSSRLRRPTAIAVGVLLLVIVGGVAILVLLVDGGGSSARRGSGTTTTTAPIEIVSTTTTTTRPPVHYRVRAGDTLTRIADRFHVTNAAIIAANEIADPNRLVAGQTLVIPSPRAVRLTVSLTRPRGRTVRFRLTGGQPGELVAFEVAWATGAFTGPSHAASPRGVVTATYSPASDAAPGIYSVTARGVKGTTAQAAFVVNPPAENPPGQ